MRVSFSRVSLFFLLLFTSLHLHACAPGTPSPTQATSPPSTQPPTSHPTARPTPKTPDAEVITLRFLTLDTASYFLPDLIAEFEADNPDIHIEPLYRTSPPASGEWTGLADVATPPFIGPEETWRGLLLDLTPLIEADRGFDVDDFFPGALRLFRWDGGIWAIPLGLDFSLLVYRSDMLQTAGLSAPQAGWTWDDFLDTAEQLADGDRRYGYGPWGCDYASLGWVESRAGDLFTESAIGLTPRLDRPEVQAAVEEYIRQAVDSGAVVREPFGGNVEAWEMFLAGKVAMTQESLSNLPGLSRQYPDLFAVAAFPQTGFPNDVQAGFFNLLAISAGTAQPQAAWRWVRFLSLRGFSPVRAMDGAVLPARRSVAEERDVWSQISPDEAQAISAILAAEEQYSSPPPGGPEQEIYNALYYAILEVRAGRADAGAALAEAQEKAVAALAERQERMDRARATPVSIATAPPGGGAVITFLAGEDAPLYESLAAEFNQQHPAFHLVVSSVLEPGESADCLVVKAVGDELASPDARRRLLSLAPLVDATPGFPLSDFYPQALEAATWAGELWFLPATISPLTLYYNPEIFASAGEPLPPDDWTIRDVLNAAERLSIPDQGIFGYLPVAAPEVSFLLDQQGIALFEAGVPPRPRFADAEVTAALDSLRRLGDSGRVLQDPSLAATRIREGRVAMWLSLYVPSPEPPPQARVVAMRPRPGTSMPLSVYGWGLDAGAAQPEGCWRWLTFLTERAIAPGEGLSARRSVAEGQNAQEGAAGERYRAMAATLTQATTSHSHEEDWEIAVKGWMRWWFYRALEDADLETALPEAQAKAETFLSCLGEAAAEMEDARYDACAREVDPEYTSHRR